MNYEELLKRGPYELGAEEKKKIYADMLSELTDSHRKRCLIYDRCCSALGDVSGSQRREEEIPMVPVSMFKEMELRSVPTGAVFKTVTSSGTTGQKTSKIVLDERTAAWQQQTLQRIMADFIGEKRIPMLIIDAPNVLRDRALFSARGAGILGFSIFGSKRCYALKEDMSLDLETVEAFLEKAGDGPVLVFGFTYMIWKYFYEPLKRSGHRLHLEHGFLIHGGGWKKLAKEAVSAEKFRDGLREVCGILDVRNYYGMAEQTGCIYMECECGHLHVSSYSDVLIRNMEDFSCCKNGTEGVIQVLTPMAWSYPGHSVLTEDKGMIVGEDDCPCGRKGKYIKITGRIPQAEIRGCSDTFETGKELRGENEAVTLLAGEMEITSVPEIPFEETTMEFLSALSERIRELPRMLSGEEMHSLGFWLRRSNLESYKKRYENCGFRLGLGQTFHIAPSNVPLLFVYTMAIGLLAGNSCRVRVSARRNTESEKVCELIDELLGLPEFQVLKRRISIVTYGRENREATEKFSRECDGRVIWGGDMTVEEIRKIPIGPSASEVVFPDRASIAVFDADAVLALSEEGLAETAMRFYNDTFSMDQNACACPRAVFWRESCPKTGEAAAGRFWQALAQTAKRYGLTEHKVSVKYGDLWELAAGGARIVKVRKFENRLYVTEMKDIPGTASEQRMRFGSFLEYHMKNGEEWISAVSEKTQALVYFGVEKQELRECVLHHRLRGTHQIVPVGQTLWMDLVWDGKDMIQLLSRTIR